MIRTHYDNLQVTRNASEVVIRVAYKGLAQKNHPDKFDGRRDEAERIMKILNEAYAVLSDPARRKMHNEWIDREIAAENSRLRAAMPEDAAGAGGGRVHANTGPTHHRDDAWDGSRRQHMGWRRVKKLRLSPRGKGHLCLFSGVLCAVLALRIAAGWNYSDKRIAVSFLLACLILMPFAFAYYRDAILPAKSVAGSVALLVIFFGFLMFGGLNMIFHGDVWYGLAATLAFGWVLVTMYRGWRKIRHLGQHLALARQAHRIVGIARRQRHAIAGACSCRVWRWVQTVRWLYRVQTHDIRLIISRPLCQDFV